MNYCSCGGCHHPRRNLSVTKAVASVTKELSQNDFSDNSFPYIDYSMILLSFFISSIVILLRTFDIEHNYCL